MNSDLLATYRDHTRPLAAYRGFASRIYLPIARELEALSSAYMPYAFVLFDSTTMTPGGLVGAQQTGNGYTSQPEDCWITHLVGSSVIQSEDAGPMLGRFALQIYDAGRQKLWTPQPINFGNSLGSAGEPFWLKRLYLLPAMQQLQCQVVNIETVSNAIQVVAWGLRK